MENKNIEAYEYGETLNQLTSARAELFRLLERKANTDASIMAINRRINRLTKEAEAEAIRRGLDTAEREPKPTRWPWLFAPVLVVAGFVIANAIMAEPVPMPTAIAPAVAAEVVEPTLTVEEQIRAIAAEHDFQWTDYIVSLAECESGLDPNAVNTIGNTPEGSRDRGLFQINDHHHPEVSDAVAFDVRLSTEWTMWRIENGYQHEWMCDEAAKNRNK